MELRPPTSPLHRSTARGHPRAGSTLEPETPLPLEGPHSPQCHRSCMGRGTQVAEGLWGGRWLVQPQQHSWAWGTDTRKAGTGENPKERCWAGWETAGSGLRPQAERGFGQESKAVGQGCCSALDFPLHPPLPGLAGSGGDAGSC